MALRALCFFVIRPAKLRYLPRRTGVWHCQILRSCYIYIAAGLGQVEESRCIALRTSHHLTLSHPDQQVSLPFTFTSYGAGFGISEKETGNQNNAKGSQSKSKEAGGINRQSCALLSVFDLGQCQAYS